MKKKETAETLKVITFDKVKIENYINAVVPSENGVKYVAHLDAMAAKNCMVDFDCCYHFLHPCFINGNVETVYFVEVSKYTRKATDDGWHIHSCAFVFPFSIDDLLENYKSGETTLREFIRYKYNPRIEKNTRDFLALINAQ